jgi:parallel beta-helix repeat protein
MKIAFRVVLVCPIALLITGFAQAATITLTSPNGGQVWRGGSSQNITWSAEGPEIDHIRLSYSINGGSTYPNVIDIDTEDDGIYEWTIPTENSTEVRVKAIAEDSNNNTLAEDTSNGNFTIDSTAPYIVSSVPPAGATDVPLEIDFSVTFSERMDGASVFATLLELRDPTTTMSNVSLQYLVDIGSVSAYFNPSGDVLSVTSATELEPNTTYQIVVIADDPDHPIGTDVAGNPLDMDETLFEFITVHATYHVDDDAASGGDGSSEHPFQRIQDGIDAAAVDGDTVLVADGTYTGTRNVDLDLGGKAITVKSENGAANCIIDCQNTDNTRGFYFHSGEGSDSVLDGFTIRNGKAGYGGGIHCYSSSPTVTNSTIMGNSADYGGGISCQDSSSPTITNNTITGNSADYGGGIYCELNSSPTITDNAVTGNSAAIGSGGGIYCEDLSSPTIVSNAIIGNLANYSGGVWCQDNSSPTMMNNTITGNPGGGVGCWNNSSLMLTNTILWDNSPQEIYLGGSDTVTISYSDVEGGQAGIDGTVNWLDGNMDADPMFVDAPNGDYHLSDYSPCIGAGTSNGAPAEDIEGNTRGTPPDIGAYENRRNMPLQRFTIRALSPVDLEVTDPQRRMISKTESAIPLASYDEETDLNYDGEPDDEVTIPGALMGNYSIRVVPEPGAGEMDTYTLDVIYGSKSTNLATNVAAEDKSYTFFFPQRNMGQGWNLISIPVKLPSSINVVLQSIIPHYSSVWTYETTVAGGEWKRFIKNGPWFLNNLWAVDAGKGYWVQMSDSTILTLAGDEVAAEPSPLKPGWNLVGCNSLTAGRVEDVIANAPGCKSVWTYESVSYGEGEWKKYIVGASSGNNLEWVESGKGYWVDVQEGFNPEWDVSGSVGTAPAAYAMPPTFSVSTDRPGIPCTIWGSIEANGVKMTGRATARRAPTVILKVDDEVQSSYQLGTVSQYGDYYVLDVPTTVTRKPKLATPDSSTQVELYVQFEDTITKAASIPQGRPGEIMQLDLYVNVTPEASLLYQNYPNPFNPDTWIPYRLKEDADVAISIYTSTGQLVRRLSLGHKPAGFYIDRQKAAYWDGKNEAGEHIASGVYFYSIKAGDLTAIRKMAIVR